MKKVLCVLAVMAVTVGTLLVLGCIQQKIGPKEKEKENETKAELVACPACSGTGNVTRTFNRTVTYDLSVSGTVQPWDPMFQSQSARLQNTGVVGGTFSVEARFVSRDNQILWTQIQTAYIVPGETHEFYFLYEVNLPEPDVRRWLEGYFSFRPYPIIKTPTYIETVEEVCPNCNGTGKVPKGQVRMVCPQCWGTGNVLQPLVCGHLLIQEPMFLFSEGRVEAEVDVTDTDDVGHNCSLEGQVVRNNKVIARQIQTAYIPPAWQFYFDIAVPNMDPEAYYEYEFRCHVAVQAICPKCNGTGRCVTS